MQVTSVSLSGYAGARNKADLRHYFEYSSEGIEVVEDGLPEIQFGEYLVDQGLIDRFQLFRTLQLQDRTTGLQLGAAVAILGYAPASAIERLYARFQELATIDVDL